MYSLAVRSFKQTLCVLLHGKVYRMLYTIFWVRTGVYKRCVQLKTYGMADTYGNFSKGLNNKHWNTDGNFQSDCPGRTV